tara:strand:+ start:158 stop:508 length:351 start_codon:yes stop_codon:yes gene_type:complete
MYLYLFKIIITAILIVIISEIAKISGRFGGMIAALPITTFLVLFWMYVEGVADEKIANYMSFTVYFLIPTLPMFILFPFLIKKFSFILAIIISIALTALLIYLFNHIYNQFGFKIF